MSRLKAALDPRSVAIIGASENPNKVGGRPVHYLDKFGFKGKIFPINPSRTEVQGYKCYNNLDDLPEAPEMVIVAVAGDNAIGAVDDCAAHGVKIAVVMASGFGEVDAVAGKAKERRMVEAAHKAGCASSARIRKGLPISVPARSRASPPCSWIWTGPKAMSQC
jgi:acyl-CoA synthetase (NDP forming)